MLSVSENKTKKKIKEKMSLLLSGVYRFITQILLNVVGQNIINPDIQVFVQGRDTFFFKNQRTSKTIVHQMEK